MTDEIKDIFKELKARAHSPLFGSFVISWLCINWYIPVVLIFYSQTDVKLDGYRSIGEAVVDHFSWWYNAILPFLMALIYTFVYPRFRVFIKEYTIGIDTNSDNRIVEITAAAISHKKIIDELNAKYTLLEQLRENERQTHEKAEANHNKSLNDYKKLEERLDKTDQELNYQIGKFKLNEELNNDNFLDGQWEFKKEDYAFSSTMQNWSVANGKVIVDNVFYANLYKLIGFGNYVSITFKVQGSVQYKTLIMNLSSDRKSMTGIDELGAKISLIKI
jgi:hypothetical protein